jgi:ABC-2 type transport system ATP-binding protein
VRLHIPRSFAAGVTAAIEVHGLIKQYGAVTAVGGIEFSVAAGSVFSFLGPNGAGKTTTTEILEGLRRRTAGEVRVLDLDPWTDGSALHRRIGVIPQDFRFFEKITAREAVEYYRALFHTEVDPGHLLAQVELLDKIDARFDTLSGGQKQKLGLALALTNNPEICFLDEPTTGLDPHARRAIWAVIRSLKREGRTVFLTTHYLEEAELLADQVAIINHGKIIATGTPNEIIRAHGRPERIEVEGPPELASYLQSHLGIPAYAEDGRVFTELTDKRDALKILAAIDASGLPWGSFQTSRDTLEDVFVRLVGQMDEGALKQETPG